MESTDKEELRKMLVDTLESHSYIESEKHLEDHEWIAAVRLDLDKRKARYERIKERLITYGIQATIAGIIAITWYALTQWRVHG